MKKSLLALAVVAVAASANAATVYDKDGTSLAAGGRVQSVYYSNNYNFAGKNDSSIQNSGRFSLAGRTQITDWVAGFGFAEWDVHDGESKGNNWTARDQYVGADFGEYGKLQAGKFRDAAYYAEEVTDHFEDAGSIAEGNFGARRPGQIMYTYDNYGFHGQFGIQTAQDNVALFGDKHGAINRLVFENGLGTDGKYSNKYAVDSGYSLSLGYTFDDVLFGPLSFRAGYSYVKGQGTNDLVTYTVTNGAVAGTLNKDFGNSFKNFKNANAGIAWGNLNSGLYLAALYEYGKVTDLGGYVAKNSQGFIYEKNDIKVKGYELVAGYAFDNGVSFLTGYEVCKYQYDETDLNNPFNRKFSGKFIAGDALLPISFTVKRIPVFVNYKINANFNVWAEAGFNAGSNHAQKGTTPIARNIDHTVFSVGARYTF